MTLRASLWVVLLLAALYTLPLAAQHSAPSRPFLERAGFLLESAGFRAHFANDEATRKALRALPPHRFVVRGSGDAARYVYADPGVCNCIFSGSREAFLSYRDMLTHPRPGVDDVAPDYKTQASALLADDPLRFEALEDPATVDVYFTEFR
jgi:hypothetical protein